MSTLLEEPCSSVRQFSFELIEMTSWNIVVDAVYCSIVGNGSDGDIGYVQANIRQQLLVFIGDEDAAAVFPHFLSSHDTT